METQPSSTPYDVLPYPGSVQDWTHPDLLATKAWLRGMTPALAEKCRFLELGCGDGSNLVALAYALPESEFTGIDLAAGPLADGQRTIDHLGLKNIVLRQQDMMRLSHDFGQFDYIAVPGLYSWVPAEVREKILEICQACLAPAGVAIVSYNALPGCSSTKMLRDMLWFHVGSISDPKTKVRQARGLLKILTEVKGSPGSYQDALEKEAKRIANYADAVFYHDDLSPHFHPVFFHQFVEHANRHGLQFLGERVECILDTDGLREPILSAVRQLEKCSVAGREQYLDFIFNRRFRCTLLCNANQPLTDLPDLERVRSLRLVSALKSECLKIDLATVEKAVIEGENGNSGASTHLLTIAAMQELAEHAPESIPFQELIQRATERLEKRRHWSPKPKEDAETLARFILFAAVAEIVILQRSVSRACLQISERPRAHALARFLVRERTKVPSFFHTSVSFDDELGSALFTRLDGTRTVAQLTRELNEILASGAATLSDGATEVTGEQVEHRLAVLAQLGVLEA